MSLNEFVVAFVGIVIGLGVADLLVSLHKLLRAGKRVKWDLLTPAFAAMMLLATIVFWWWAFEWYRDGQTLTIAQFLPRFAFLCFSFLMMAAALPDEVPEQGIVLSEFYAASRIHRWSLVAASLLLSTADIWIDEWRRSGSPWQMAVCLPLVSFALAVAAACIGRKWVQWLAIGWIFAVTIWFNLNAPIGGG